MYSTLTLTLSQRERGYNVCIHSRFAHLHTPVIPVGEGTFEIVSNFGQCVDKVKFIV